MSQFPGQDIYGGLPFTNGFPMNDDTKKRTHGYGVEDFFQDVKKQKLPVEYNSDMANVLNVVGKYVFDDGMQQIPNTLSNEDRNTYLNFMESLKLQIDGSMSSNLNNYSPPSTNVESNFIGANNINMADSGALQLPTSDSSAELAFGISGVNNSLDQIGQNCDNSYVPPFSDNPALTSGTLCPNSSATYSGGYNSGISDDVDFNFKFPTDTTGSFLDTQQPYLEVNTDTNILSNNDFNTLHSATPSPSSSNSLSSIDPTNIAYNHPLHSSSQHNNVIIAPSPKNGSFNRMDDSSLFRGGPGLPHHLYTSIGPQRRTVDHRRRASDMTRLQPCIETAHMALHKPSENVTITVSKPSSPSSDSEHNSRSTHIAIRARSVSPNRTINGNSNLKINAEDPRMRRRLSAGSIVSSTSPKGPEHGEPSNKSTLEERKYHSTLLELLIKKLKATKNLEKDLDEDDNNVDNTSSSAEVEDVMEKLQTRINAIRIGDSNS
ncbi:hypothetical protein K7432_007544 [Basidiobolus ranarum]